MSKITVQLSEIFQGEGEWEKRMGGDDNICMGFNIYLCMCQFPRLIGHRPVVVGANYS